MPPYYQGASTLPDPILKDPVHILYVVHEHHKVISRDS